MKILSLIAVSSMFCSLMLALEQKDQSEQPLSSESKEPEEVQAPETNTDSVAGQAS